MPKSKSKKITILGIDPGLADTGFGVIEKHGRELKALDVGCIKTKAGVPTKANGWHGGLVCVHKPVVKTSSV